MKMKCNKCGYEWETRTDKTPKACPMCKQYLDRKTVKKEEGK